MTKRKFPIPGVVKSSNPRSDAKRNVRPSVSSGLSSSGAWPTKGRGTNPTMQKASYGERGGTRVGGP
jgi:hypothetical protein